MAQENLVPNPSFEDYNYIPKTTGLGKQCIKVWTVPVITGGGDYYHSEAKGKKANTLKNEFGSQEAHSGKAYAGICVTNEFHEYLQVKLSSRLVKGQRYRFTAFISCADKLIYGHLNEFGVIFTSKTLRMPDKKPMRVRPSLLFRNKDGYKNRDGWTEITADFVAEGTERVLTFGSFLYEDTVISGSDTTFFKNDELGGLIKYAHYYVDDISVVALEDPHPQVSTLVEEEDTTQTFEIGQAYNFENIEFESSSSLLLPSSQGDLETLVNYLQNHPEVKVKIVGHTDNVGEESMNLDLSLSRAEAVAKYLSDHGVNPTKVQTDGMGGEHPISTNDTPEGRRQNRRVEVTFF